VKVRQVKPVVCPKCGQEGDMVPGFDLGEFDHLEGVWVQDQSVPTPQKLTCRNCQYSWPVARGSIEVRRG